MQYFGFGKNIGHSHAFGFDIYGGNKPTLPDYMLLGEADDAIDYAIVKIAGAGTLWQIDEPNNRVIYRSPVVATNSDWVFASAASGATAEAACETYDYSSTPGWSHHSTRYESSTVATCVALSPSKQITDNFQVTFVGETAVDKYISIKDIANQIAINSVAGNIASQQAIANSTLPLLNYITEGNGVSAVDYAVKQIEPATISWSFEKSKNRIACIINNSDLLRKPSSSDRYQWLYGGVGFAEAYGACSYAFGDPTEEYQFVGAVLINAGKSANCMINSPSGIIVNNTVTQSNNSDYSASAPVPPIETRVGYISELNLAVKILDNAASGHAPSQAAVTASNQ